MRLVFTIVAALVRAVASGALADSTSGSKLQCFSGSTDVGGFKGTCTLTSSGADLNTIDNDADPNNTTPASTSRTRTSTGSSWAT